MRESNYYKRNLPHWQPGGSEYFITFRLAGSLPAKIVARIKNERELYLREVRSKKRSLGSLAESYDRVIRDSKELENTIAHILNNPVKGRLVNRWQDWV